jgi:ribonuclease J
MSPGVSLRVHRGAREIGGNCVELLAGKSRLILDLGRPLNVPLGQPATLPAIPGLGDPPDERETAIVISHPHADHYGLLGGVADEIPVFIGQEAARLLDAALPFTDFGMPAARFKNYKHHETFRFGDFLITPFLVDHSAFDAYAVLIEANGSRIVYSGDFRMHGRKPGATRRWLSDPAVQQPDLLVIEGTRLGRSDAEDTSEQSLEAIIADKMKASPGLVLATFSPQNIDRLVTFYKAARRCRRQLLIDPYAACLLQAINRPTLPKLDKTSLGVFLPAAMRRRLSTNDELKCLDGLYPYRVYPERIVAHPEKFVLLFRASMIEDIEHMGLDGRPIHLIYSQWAGYLDQPTDRLRPWCISKGIDLQILHASGHATRADIMETIVGLNPRRILPIHTDAPEKIEEQFEGVIDTENGQWIDLPSRQLITEEPSPRLVSHSLSTTISPLAAP